ncbi:hypothetical protein U1Q18_037773, partial [Sarracenia purpurea var. burkii]
GPLPPREAEAAQVGVSGDANKTKGEGDVLKDPVENSSDLDEKKSSPPAVLEGEDSVAVEEVDEESSGEEESSEEDDSVMISVETCTEEGEKGISDAVLDQEGSILKNDKVAEYVQAADMHKARENRVRPRSGVFSDGEMSQKFDDLLAPKA